MRVTMPDRGLLLLVGLAALVAFVVGILIGALGIGSSGTAMTHKDRFEDKDFLASVLEQVDRSHSSSPLLPSSPPASRWTAAG